MPTILAIALAGSLGTATRYGIDVLAHRLSPHVAPYATFSINVVGSLMLGLLLAAHPDGRVRAALAIGFLGAFTTFSTLALQTYRALDSAQYAHAFALPAASIIAGVVAVYVGILAGQRFA